VAVAITNIQGPFTNKSLGLPSPADEENAYKAVIAGLNASGGAACRQVVPDYVQINPADPSDLQSKCLQIGQAGVFALLDGGGAAGVGGQGALCYAHSHIPFFGGLNYLSANEVTGNYPYLFDIASTLDALDHNTVFALRDEGFYSASNGFKKLGLLYSTCVPGLAGEVTGWLTQAGVPSSQVETFNFGCPVGGAFSPSLFQQAELKFKQDGVTNVMSSGLANYVADFTRVAQPQGYKPIYGLPDEDVVPLTYNNPANGPDYTNLAGALLVTNAAYGEERTPGMSSSPETAKCNGYLQSVGLPTAEQQGLGGQACDEVWMFAAAADHAPTLSREGLAAGLQAAKSVAFSYPEGPNDFSGSHVTAGGQYWRMDKFMSSCNCWQVIDPTYHPSFPSATNLS
jgi:hypothetical protein